MKIKFAALALTISVISGLLVTSPASATSVSVIKEISAKRWLSAEELASADISSMQLGSRLINDAQSSEKSVKPLRAFSFGDTSVVVSAATKIQVLETKDAAGNLDYEVIPLAHGIAISGSAGYLSPPNTAFKYNNEGQFTSISGTWIRKVWWLLQNANNYTCSGCTTYDYWRVFGRIQGSTETGSSSWDGYKRLWIEFDRTSTTAAVEFEPVVPNESFAGNGNTSTTIGFGASADISLGMAPITAGGGIDYSYSGTIIKSTENWHPVVRAESSSGGVQWCYYVASNWFTGDPNEFTGTRFLTTRVSVRHAASAPGPTWAILHGMQESYSNCPTQM